MKLTLKKAIDLKEIPDLASVMQDAKREAAHITIGETLFMKKYGVHSEAEFKKYCMEHGRVMKHSQIGWNSWENTAKGFRYIYDELEKRGSHLDRFGICLDWIMGVPEQYREKLPKGNGLIFENPEDWEKIGQVVPIQIHMGDHMIGSMNSLENTKLALHAGVTSIGNVSHYYTYEYPGVDLEKERVGDTMRAIALMGIFREKGTIIHSNLDDGFGSQFQDLVDLTGWAMLERYIVEELLGGGMSHCFGNLFSNPIVRIAFSEAMWEINRTQTPGTMIYGNTTDFDMNFEKNYGALSSFLLGDIVGQMHCPTGHAVTAIPVTEAARIPSPDEIIQANMVSDMLLEKAPYYAPYINWDKIEAEKELLVNGGKVFFERIMNGLSDIGVDLREPGQMMVALKNAGAGQLEALFGAGEEEKEAMNGRRPIRPTDIVQKITKQQEEVFEQIGDVQHKLTGVKIIAAATDVHEFGKELVKHVVEKAGAVVFDLGNNVTPEEIAETVLETESKVVLVSTYNGIALSYARELKQQLMKNGAENVFIVMGGLLNENLEGEDLPVDVTEAVHELGINTDNNADTLVDTIQNVLLKV